MDFKDTLCIHYLAMISASDIIDYMNSIDQTALDTLLSQLNNILRRNPEEYLQRMFSILQELSASSGNKSLTLICINQLKEALNYCPHPLSEVFRKYCSDNYLCIDPECLKYFFDSFNCTYTEENIISYVMYLLICNTPKKAASLIKDFDLTEKILNRFDLIYLLVSQGLFDLLYTICKKNKHIAPYSVQCLCKIKKYDEAENYIREFNLNHEEFPNYQKKAKKRSIKHFILKDRTNLFNVIELLDNDDIGLTALIEVLFMNFEERGQWMKNLAISLIEVHQHLIEFISTEYSHLIDLTQRFIIIPPDDQLSPIFSNCCQLPESINIEFVSNLNQIRNIEWQNHSVVGIDSEWRTTIGGKFEKSKNSILQIANGNDVYLIDLMITENRKELDKKLFELFGNSSICKVGVALEGDIQKLKESHPDLHCFQSPLKCYVDLINVHKRNDKTDPGGLANLCEIYLGFSLCKSEQKSNWESRPLRRSQMHYAAFDAYICLVIYSKFLDLNMLIESDLIVELKESDRRYAVNLPNYKKTCENCNSRLHNPRDCPKLKKCDFCGFIDHQADDCPCIFLNTS